MIWYEDIMSSYCVVACLKLLSINFILIYLELVKSILGLLAIYFNELSDSHSTLNIKFSVTVSLMLSGDSKNFKL